MRKTEPSFQSCGDGPADAAEAVPAFTSGPSRADRGPRPANTLLVRDLKYQAEGWILDGEIRQLSSRTLEARRSVLAKLLWFLRQRECEFCGPHELRAFLAYLTNGHKDEGGRWGNAGERQPVKPGTTASYFAILRTLFRALVTDGALEASPMENLRAPVNRPDQIQPFTEEQVQALRTAARRSKHPRRDEALVLFLLDSGCRASEVCELKFRDLDLSGRRAQVQGKGGKVRSVYFGKDTTKAMWAYLREQEREEGDALFLADRGKTAGDGLTRSGLFQLIERLGAAAKVDAVRCSPHTFRHTMAVCFLRAGGSIYALMELLGHTDLKMCKRYLALAEADVANQHRQFSPVDRLKKKG